AMLSISRFLRHIQTQPETAPKDPAPSEPDSLEDQKKELLALLDSEPEPIPSTTRPPLAPIARSPDTLFSQWHEFPRTVHWSPDGSCLLSYSDANTIQLFEMPPEPVNPVPLQPCLTMTEGEPIYDLAWFPTMTSRVPITCFFASAAQHLPIHLWD